MKNVVRKGEIACNRLFLLFSHCFLSYMVLIFHFKCTLKCHLQFVLIWTSLKFCRLVKSHLVTALVIPPQTKFGGYTGVTLSVRPSVGLSICRLSSHLSVRLSIKKSCQEHNFKSITASNFKRHTHIGHIVQCTRTITLFQLSRTRMMISSDFPLRVNDVIKDFFEIIKDRFCFSFKYKKINIEMAHNIVLFFSENQQFLKEVVASVLEGQGISWLKMGRVKKLLEDENYRNFVVSRLNKNLDKKLTDEDTHIEDVVR